MTTAIRDSINAFYSAVRANWGDFKEREGQQIMIAGIADTLIGAKSADSERDGANILAVEGKTGVGKTVGYVVPGAMVAKELKKKLILSTATVQLQEQLFKRDLPALSAISPVPFTFALAKGRGRYACNVKLDHLSGDTAQAIMFDDPTADTPPDDAHIKQITFLSKQLIMSAWDGDRDSLAEPVSNDVWGRIAADRHTCTGRQCPRYQDCAYYKSRRTLASADVIVANHDLVLASIAAESRSLPDPGGSLYVFDEAHHLINTAISHFSHSHQLHGSIQWLDKLVLAYNRCSAILPEFEPSSSFKEDVNQLLNQFRALYKSLSNAKAFSEKAVLRFPNGKLSPNFLAYADQIYPLVDNIFRATAKVAEAIAEERQESEGDKSLLDKAAMDMGFFNARIGNLWDVWHNMLADENPPIAKFIEKKQNGNHTDFAISASPIVASKALSESLWSRAAGVVLASATMKALGSFDFFLRMTGLDTYPKVRTLDVPSPFDYKSQGIFVVPAMRSDPSDAAAHTAELCQTIPVELERAQRGALVLFTSRRQMDQVYQSLPPKLAADVLTQGSLSRTALVQEHVRRVRAGSRSVLFGLTSLGEGLDLPGELCELVIIAKLPFVPPDSPVEEALAEWLESQSRNPFNEISVPAVGQKLTQWAGRGIRTESDHARIVCMDTRLVSKRYGHQILAGLPAFRQELAGQAKSGKGFSVRQ